MLQTVYIVRTADKSEHPHAGFDERDVQLSQLGLCQARDFADFTRLIEADHLFVSPQYRTLQTASEAAVVLETDLELEPGLAPWYLPVKPCTGLHAAPAPLEQLHRLFPRVVQKDDATKASSRLGETYDEMRQRVEAAFNSIVKRCDADGSETVILVTHAAPAIVLGALLGGPKALSQPIETGGLRKYVRNDSNDAREWHYDGAPKYLRTARRAQHPWSLDEVALVPTTGVQDRDGGIDIQVLAQELMGKAAGSPTGTRIQDFLPRLI